MTDFVSSNKFVILISQDGDQFEINSNIAKQSNLLNNMIDESDDNEDDKQEIPILNILSNTLSKVIEFMNHYHIEPMTEIPKPIPENDITKVVSKWYAEFVDLDNNTLFELINAANYLDITSLLNLTCAAVALKIKGKTPEEICQTFGIESNNISVSPEEEAKIREENLWCEEA